jgi:hypothetical protein
MPSEDGKRRCLGPHRRIPRRLERSEYRAALAQFRTQRSARRMQSESQTFSNGVERRTDDESD